MPSYAKHAKEKKHITVFAFVAQWIEHIGSND